MFARYKDEENIKAVERLLNSHTELEMFERSQLGKWFGDQLLARQMTHSTHSRDALLR